MKLIELIFEHPVFVIILLIVIGMIGESWISEWRKGKK